MNPVKTSCLAFAASLFALLGLLAAAGCGEWADDLVCHGPKCEFTKSEWARVQSLANLGDPEIDPSNAYSKTGPAIEFGHRLYFDPYFAGPAFWEDSLGRPVPSPRPVSTGGAAKCDNKRDPSACPKMKLSCADCHNPAAGGGDITSSPHHVSQGSGWYDVNSQQVLNVAHYKLLYWNGRSDSLWAQAAAVMESEVSMNGNRMEIVRRVAERYAAEYLAVFGEAPPTFVPVETLPSVIVGKENGAFLCKSDGPEGCPADTCIMRTLPVPGSAVPGEVATKCYLRYPLRGKAGKFADCQTNIYAEQEPFFDAFDCMADEDRGKINRAFSNIVKAIAAYEETLASQNAPFDQYANGADGALTASAVRGLKLFVGRASCIDCHKTPLFSDGEFHNIGVPQRGLAVPTESECVGGGCDCGVVPRLPPEPDPQAPAIPTAVLKNWPGASCLPWGLYTGMARLANRTFRRDGDLSNDKQMKWKETHQRFYDITKKTEAPPASSKGQWRTPSLRDVALTGPYMHDGVYQTLDEVIWHYDVGGTAVTTGTKAPELRPLLLTPQDRLDLVEFLKSLTGGPSPTWPHGQHLPPTTPIPPR